MKYPENMSKNEDGAAAKEQPLPFSQGGIVVGMNKLRGKERIYCIQDDVHTLCLGATRSGKSRTVVLQSICTLGLAGESLVISDPKAELYHYTHEFLQKLNYDVYALDFRTPEKSHHYNLLQPIIDAALRGDQEQAEMLAWDMTNVLVGKSQGEKIWTNGEMSVIAATILSVVWDNAKRPEYQNLTNVYWFLAEMNRQIGNNANAGLYEASPAHPSCQSPAQYFRHRAFAHQGKFLYFSSDDTASFHVQIHLCHYSQKRLFVNRIGGEETGAVYHFTGRKDDLLPCRFPHGIAVI